MGKRQIEITDELINTVCSVIRQGAYDHAAARACGVSAKTFYRWIEDEVTYNSEQHERFREAVLQAKAEARVSAEIRVHIDDPKTWLMRGPGREREHGGLPGWVSQERVELTQSEPLRVAHAHVHVNAPMPAQGTITREYLLELTDEQLDALERKLLDERRE